ncbi:Hermansky-Pudlak syndrome 5 protein homolog [Ostrinia furnacalis]|uniref:Hermansky-Pudlak syndrome 5 protein homolog n=1 Tax=Ostrinia furnacalis TaxID=93504 RepID=UPI00103E36DE|nr:Hermansky-Pudlak syndrome 5 protein homolog [Ostrinia furnacalis]
MTSKLPPYILHELPDISEYIKFPLLSVQRIKYTCFDVSRTLIAFGATSGGIYVFNRCPCEFIQLIPNKDGAITRLAISAAEKHISFANGRGIVTVTACDQSLSGGHSAVTSKEHQGNEVTAMVWSANNMLFTGDDVGKISVLQLQSFIAKTMFQSSSQTIMSLDSRICQLDIKASMLLVSTLTRCYICDTSQEQYRQIGQKLRDGEYGACFYNKEKTPFNTTHTNQDVTEVKRYNIVDVDTGFAVSKELENTLIYCARPSSRLWEATIDGTVKRTHQYKQVLAKNPMTIVSLESYTNENISRESINVEGESQAINFPRIYSVDSAIFSFKRDALYFLNLNNVDDTMWFTYKDIIDCKVYHDMIYLWLANGSLVTLRYMKLQKFLVKCYIDEKYVLCTELCSLFRDYLLENDLSDKLHILVGLRDKLQNKEELKNIDDVLEKFDNLKTNEATQMKSGIYVVDNTFHQSTLLEEDVSSQKFNDDNMFTTTLSPEALQAFKDLSVTVSDKFSSSKKILKEKWEDFEGKMKNLSAEKHTIQELRLPKRIIPDIIADTEYEPNLLDDDIIYKESSQKAIEIEDIDNNSIEQDKVCKSLYQYYRLSLVGKESERPNLVSTIESYACDIRQIYELMLLLEQYCVSVGDADESKFVSNNIFLIYLCCSNRKKELLDSIIEDEELYKYFVDSCISVNMKTQKLSNIGCECGFPLPYTRTNQTPVFSELIDEFIERQWSSQCREQCYETCRRMPYLWRKILYLRRNEDLLNVLRILLQMLDESLLHSFLPQFTLESWDRAIQLYATLHANMCLNCNKKFHHISVKDMLSWDDLGALIIKSVGGKNAVNVLRKHAKLIDLGELSMKFYHTAMLVAMYEKYDVTITSQLTETLYSAYEFEDSRAAICSLLRNTVNGQIKNTAVPLIVAAKTDHWGLTPPHDAVPIASESSNETETVCNKIKDISFLDIVDNLSDIYKHDTDCTLCGLPLQNEVLIQDGGLWVFKCGHLFHGACLDVNKIKLCPTCPK